MADGFYSLHMQLYFCARMAWDDCNFDATAKLLCVAGDLADENNA